MDLAVIGQFTDKIGTAQVNVGSEVADLVTPLAVAFGTAGQVYVAQLTGAGDRTKTRHTVGTLLSWMILLSIVLRGPAAEGLQGRVRLAHRRELR